MDHFSPVVQPFGAPLAKNCANAQAKKPMEHMEEVARTKRSFLTFSLVSSGSDRSFPQSLTRSNISSDRGLVFGTIQPW